MCRRVIEIEIDLLCWHKSLMFLCTEYEMMGGEMSENAIETTMMTERHLQQAVSSKSPAEEQIYSTYALEKMSTDLQIHLSDLPITQSMLRGVASWTKCWDQLMNHRGKFRFISASQRVILASDVSVSYAVSHGCAFISQPDTHEQWWKHTRYITTQWLREWC